MDLHSLSRAELEEQAEALGVTYKNNIKDETLIKKLEAELNGDDDSTDSKGGEKKLLINFAADKKDKQPVFFGLNGKSYRFPRGKFVECPRELLPTIQNATQRIQDDETGEWTEIPTYQYQTKEA